MNKQKVNEIVNTAFICDTIFTIDPGKSNGAIAKKQADKIETWDIKKIHSFDDLCDFWAYQREICKLPICFLEKITTFQSDVPDKREDAKGYSQAIGKMFQMKKLKDHYVELRSALRTNLIPFIEIMPLQWQKNLRIYIPGEDYKIRKRRYKDIATERFPQIKVTLTNCDALLLTDFAMKKLNNDPLWIKQNLKERINHKIF